MVHKARNTKRKPKSKIGICSYHLCRRRTRVYKCKYCENYFCKKHLRPKIVTSLHQVSTAKEPLRSYLEREYRSEFGHPDLVYTKIVWERLKRKEIEEREKIWKTLDKLKEKHIIERKPPIIEFPKPDLKSIVKPAKNIEKKLPKSFREIWYELGITLYSFVKYTMIVIIVLTLLHLFLVGKFGLLPLILRSVGLIFVYYIIAFFYRKTKYTIPWKWVTIGILVLISAHIYSTGDYSTLKIFDKLTGIEKFTDTLILSFSNVAKAPTTILKPRADIVVGKTLFRYKSPEEIKNDKIQELIDKSYQLEREVHRLTNQKRIQQGLNALELDEKLSNIARYHSKDMAIRNYFDHVSPDGEDVDTRYSKFNYDCRISVGNYIYSGAENLFLNNIIYSYSYDSLTGKILEYTFNTFEEISSSTVDGWMNSKGHRKNILTSFWRKEGIGIYVDEDGEIYITQNFC